MFLYEYLLCKYQYSIFKYTVFSLSLSLSLPPSLSLSLTHTHTHSLSLSFSFFVCTHHLTDIHPGIYIYIYIERERERVRGSDREAERDKQLYAKTKERIGVPPAKFNKFYVWPFSHKNYCIFLVFISFEVKKKFQNGYILHPKA